MMSNELLLTNSQNLKKYIFTAIVVGALNLFSYGNKVFAFAVVLIECIILGYTLCLQRYNEYYSFWLIFLCMSFEFEQTVGTEAFYGFKSFEILGISLSTWMLFPLLVMGVLKKGKVRKKSVLSAFMLDVLALGILGIVNGIINIVINDNGICIIGNGIQLLFLETYVKFIMEFLIVLAFICVVKRDKEKISDLQDAMLATLLGTVVTMVLSRLTNTMGIYGGIETLQVQNVVRYIPFLFIYSLSEVKNKAKIIVFCVGVIGGILTLKYNATGKMILLYILVAAVVILIEFQKNKALGIVELVILGISIMLVLIKVLQDYETYGMMFRVKFEEVKSLLQFGEGWVSNMSPSPRIRIAEIQNIFVEYFHKPWRAICGKGYLGSITDHVGLLGDVGTGAYSATEIKYGLFWGVHESFSSLLLANGVVGLCFLIKYTRLLLSGITKSMKYLCALFWLWMSYGFSFTLTGFGLTALLLCMYEIDQKRKLQV